MKVGIIGGGIFGCTIAAHLANDGHTVHLYEAQDGLLRSTTAGNQLRLHEGYHYPRSFKTFHECQLALEEFKALYRQALVTVPSYYAIARRSSKIRPDDYLEFLDRTGLAYTISSTPRIRSDTTELVVKVHEVNIDPARLRGLVWRRLYKAGVNIHTKVYVTPTAGFMRDHDAVVLATYAWNNNFILSEANRRRYQFEICEKPVIRMAEDFHCSIVVLDGPFCSIDPYGRTGYHVLGHVKHAIHNTTTGFVSDIPSGYRELIDKGMLPRSKIFDKTQFAAMRADAARFIRGMQHAEHMGSMFSIRAVLPDVDETDERPTLVDQIDDRIIRVFSGKIGTAQSAAERTLATLNKMGG